MTSVRQEASSTWLPGSAKEAIKNPLDLNTYLIPHPSTTFLVKVKWESMIWACIADGDIVMVDKSIKHKSWDIVIAHIDQQSALRYYMIDENHTPFLQAANSDYKNMYAENELTIFWVVSAVIRKM